MFVSVNVLIQRSRRSLYKSERRYLLPTPDPVCVGNVTFPYREEIDLHNISVGRTRLGTFKLCLSF